MTEDDKPALLWVDDDDPRRHEGEIEELQEASWRVELTGHVAAAAERLQAAPFALVLLDQMLAGPDAVRGDLAVWGGCRLLHWLRESANRPWPGEDPSWAVLDRLRPHAANITAPVVIVSGYFNRTVLDATEQASAQDRDLKRFAKPVDIGALTAFLEKIKRGV